MNSTIITIIVTAIVLVAIAVIYIKEFKHEIDKISFRETLDLTELPIITFQQGSKKFNFLLDTGSAASHINKKLIDNRFVEYMPTNSKINVTGMEGNWRTNDIVNVKLSLRGKEFIDEFIVNDLNAAFTNIKEDTGVTLHGIVGVSFFDKYKYIIDFNECVVYSKK